MAFSDIPIRVNNKDNKISAEWFNTIRTELIAAFGLGGYIKESASSQSIANGGTVTLDSTAFKQMIHVDGDGGAVTLSLTPFGTSHGLSGGKEIILVGSSDTNTVTIEVSDTANGMISNGKIVLTKYKVVHLIYSELNNRFINKDA